MYYSYRQRSHCTSRHCTFYLHMSIYVFAVHAGWDFLNENLSNSLRFSLKSGFTLERPIDKRPSQQPIITLKYS